MQSPEDTRIIGKCKWCGCILFGRFFMNSLEEMFWEKGYPDCEHYDPDYPGGTVNHNGISNQNIEEAANVTIADEIKAKDVTCPKYGELYPVLHCEKCGHNWKED